MSFYDPVLAIFGREEPLENDFLNMPPEGTQQEGAEVAGKFSGDVFGGAVKARAFGDLNGDEVEHPTELLLLPLLASEDQQVMMIGFVGDNINKDVLLESMRDSTS